ncbi:MAG: ABC transporter [Gammaproteobacteria bacterium]|nr:ABC transporter [Gammaproteobacteria bacterium]
MTAVQKPLLIALAVLLFFVFNAFNHLVFKDARLDLTEGQLYTLSEGSLNLVQGVEEPVQLYFFFSEAASRDLTPIRTYADRVESMLEEFALASNGMLLVERIDPAPFSEAEDEAAAFGLQAVPVSATGDSLYFGLAGSDALDNVETIPFFQPDREMFLEYEISQLIDRLARPKREMVGLISTLPVTNQVNPQTFQPEPGWQSILSLEDTVTLESIDVSAEEIPEGLAALVLIHPKSLPDQMKIALVRYLASGGKVIAFLDPLAEMDRAATSPMMPSLPSGQASSLNWLTRSLGVQMREAEVLGDPQLALSVSTPSGAPTRHLAILGLSNAQLNSESIVTAQLDSLNFASAGFFDIDSPTVAVETLIESSEFANGIAASQLQFLQNPEDLMQSFSEGSEARPIAVRLSGPTTLETGLEGDAPLEVSNLDLILVSDTDVLSDRLWVQVQNFFGQQVATAFADNGSLLTNLVDYFAGSQDLISVRSRGRFTRPFEVVQSLRREAEAQYLASAEQLQLELNETERQLADLESQQESDGVLRLSDEQEAALVRFQDEKLRIRKALRDVRHRLDQDIDQLGEHLKLLNIIVLPILLTLMLAMAAWAQLRKR